MDEVSLIICPPWDTKMPSLGVGYIVSYLRSCGIKAKVYDLNIDLYNFSKDKKDWDLEMLSSWSDRRFAASVFSKNSKFIERYVDKIVKCRYICFSTNIGNVNSTIEIAKKIKERRKKNIICIGGPITDFPPNKELKEVADYIISGEGEMKLATLLKSLKSGKKPSAENKDFFAELKELPFPTYDEFNLKSYTSRELPLCFSRGCYGKCNFCSDWKRRPFSVRKGKSVFEEVKYHVKKNKIRKFRFTDLLINGNAKELEEFCDLVIKDHLDILWWSNAVINIGIRKEIYAKMKKAGCYYLEYGVESFSPHVIKLMNKPFKYEHIYPVLKNTLDAGIRAGINILIGYPGETEKDFNEHLENFRKHYLLFERVSNLNMVYLYSISNLNLNPLDYDIIMENKNDFLKWHTKDNKNTYEIRLRRLVRMIRLLQKLKIPFSQNYIEQIRKDLSKHVNLEQNKADLNEYIENIYRTRSPLYLFFDSMKMNGIWHTLKKTLVYIIKGKIRYYRR
jgi:hypothetical protein